MSEFLKFTKVGSKIINLESISFIDCSQIEKLILEVNFISGIKEIVEGLDAIELMMIVKPSAFEGKKLKFPKNIWIIHNLIAHPIMQILCLIGFKKQGIWLHDVTVPRPIGIKQ